jgi:hypothetical protein
MREHSPPMRHIAGRKIRAGRAETRGIARCLSRAVVPLRTVRRQVHNTTASEALAPIAGALEHLIHAASLGPRCDRTGHY